MSDVSILLPNLKIKISYPFPIDIKHRRLVQQAMMAYYASISNFSNHMLNSNLMALIEKYRNGIAFEEIEPPEIVGEPILALTTGKDSLHALMSLLDMGYKPHLFYLDRINKSEAFYEKPKVKEIAKKFDLPLHIPQVTYSAIINRQNHNIGFRELLIYGAAIPYMQQHNLDTIIFGIWRELREGPLSGDSHQVMSTYSEISGYKYSFHPLGIEYGEDKCIKDFCEKYYDLFPYVTSCYTQINYREKMYENISSKTGFPIYHGCGYCIKCCRINLGLIAYTNLGCLKSRKLLLGHIEKQIKIKNLDDPVINSLLKVVYK